MYRIGVDVGGTFTDLVAIDEGGLTTLAKVPSTPEDPSLGVVEGLSQLAGRFGVDRAALLRDTERIVHGTTVATNALLEHKGARLGLLTTEGHRDVVEMREGLKDDRYNLRMPPPEQLVPRRLRLPVRERIRADGRGLAAGAVLSGPAGGAAGSVYASRLLGEPNLIPFDMGGTSTDICLVVDCQAALVMDRKIAGHRIALGSLDIASIGAGGGSIARVDAGGILHVGPESAGAAPGPACYGQGGAEPTVTDANLVLGYLDPANFLGGARRLDEGLAALAVDRIAAALGIDRLAAAHGIHRVINTNMAEGVRLVSVRRGVDPRRFALFAFGGAAGLHATDIARQLGLVRVIVPRVASVLSAWGMLATDLRFELSRTHIGDAKVLDGAAVKHLFDEMEAEGLARLRASFAGPARAARSVGMRYGEQVFESTGRPADVECAARYPRPQTLDGFARRHEALCTHAMPDQETVLVNARVAVSGILEELPQEPDLPGGPPTSPETERRIYLDDWIAAPVYAFDRLAPSQVISGPAIVESATTTVLLRPGDRATITPQGWLDIVVGSAAEG